MRVYVLVYDDGLVRPDTPVLLGLKLRSFLSSSTVFVFYSSVVINVSITFAFDWHVSFLK